MTITDAGISVHNSMEQKTSYSPRLSIFVAALGVSLACLDIAGWFLHIRNFVAIVPGMPAMAFPTALSFIAASAAIATRGKVSSIAAWTMIVIAVASQSLPFLLHTQALSLLNDSLIQHNFPRSSMSINVAFLFVLFGTAILLFNRPQKPQIGNPQVLPYQGLALAVATIAFTCLLAYWFRVIHIFGVAHYLGMAAVTGILFIVFSVTLLFRRPSDGIIGVLTSDTITGRSSRRLLPVAIIAPLVLGNAAKLALYVHASYGLFLAYLVVILSMILLAILIWNNILALHDQVKRAEAYQARLAEVERKKIVTALEATKDQLSLALEGAQLGTWHWDLESGRRIWSEQCKRLFGLPLDADMSLQMLTDCIHPEDQPLFHEARRKSIDNNEDYEVEYRVIWPDGSIHWLNSRGKVYCGPDGKATRFEGISQDVSIRHLIEERQQQFLKDMLASVTDAKLLLCLHQKELPTLATSVVNPIKITADNGGIRQLRDAAFDACLSASQPPERCYDMKTAVGEAAMNSAVHAECGTGEVYVTDTGTVQVIVSDHGTGIALENLPNATLKKGYTTAGTLGHGMKMMLQTVDRIYLLTGTNGTTVVLEQDREAKEVLW